MNQWVMFVLDEPWTDSLRNKSQHHKLQTHSLEEHILLLSFPFIATMCAIQYDIERWWFQVLISLHFDLFSEKPNYFLGEKSV